MPGGQQGQLNYGNGVGTRYDYDARLRLSRLVTGHAGLATELVHFTYALDPVSNVLGIGDQRPESALPGGDPRRNSQVFSYDDLYRLTGVRYNAPNPANENGGTIQTRYDRIGNLLAQTSDIVQLEREWSVTDAGAMTYGGAGGASGRVGRADGDPPGPHALTGIDHATAASREVIYDGNGNITRMNGLECTWDFRDRLVAVEDETMRAEYRYDYAGRRVLKRVSWIKDATSDLNGPDPKGFGSEVTSVLYPGRHFEVRDLDEPTKYVFNGGTRVARITTSVSNSDRVQRIRLQTGWNLVSLAVSVANLDEQLAAIVSGGEEEDAVVQGVYQWNAESGGYAEVASGQPVMAGAVLWIRARAGVMVSVVGTYAEPTQRAVGGGGSFVAGAGLERWAIREALDQAAWVAAWHYEAEDQRWIGELPAGLSSDPGFPEFLAPGEAVYVSVEAPVALELPEAVQRIRYYHQDHLGSSSVMTDAAGVLVEETAFHPFGVSRHEHRLGRFEEPYQFTQKERDRESGLHYFEARYLAAVFGRFASPDLKYANPGELSPQELPAFLGQPQKINLYAYALNNPVRYNDPTGLDETETMGTIADVAGIAASVAEEAPCVDFDVVQGGTVRGRRSRQAGYGRQRGHQGGAVHPGPVRSDRRSVFE